MVERAVASPTSRRRRAALLTAARETFEAKGYFATSVADIIDHADPVPHAVRAGMISVLEASGGLSVCVSAQTDSRPNRSRKP